jgi:hypothetical protein
MDEKRNSRHADGAPEVVRKAATLQAQEITEAELKAINKFTLEPLAAEDVFTFSAILCDNELDRHYERFSLKALKDLQKLFVGRTVIKDHYGRADNQVARIYATELVQSDKVMSNGEAYAALKAHCYMVRTESNKDLITEIKAGIKKEGSVGVRVASAICSICGTDNSKTYCPHWPGRSYKKEGGDVVCTFKLDGAKDAYEFSLVAVPAQRAAGVSKSYTGKTVYEAQDVPENPEAETPETNTGDSEKAKELELRARLAGIHTNN